MRIRIRRLLRGHLRERLAKQLAASGKFLLPESIAEIADAVEPPWQNVEEEATDEFLGVKGHRSLPV
jgi:hypothetical protein